MQKNITTELEFAFQEYKDNPDEFKELSLSKRDKKIKIKYCNYCGFPREACICTLEDLI